MESKDVAVDVVRIEVAELAREVRAALADCPGQVGTTRASTTSSGSSSAVANACCSRRLRLVQPCGWDR